MDKPIQPFQSRGESESYALHYEPYDEALPSVFADVKLLIQNIADHVTVEHVGSTSIPGIGGRNVLDVVIPLSEQNQPALRQALYALGFEDSPFPHYLPLLVGRRQHGDKQYPILLYLVSPGSTVFRDWLRFRNHMRTHPDDAKAYDAVKRHVLASGRVDGEHYQEAKSPFLASMSAKLRH
jgi:GrpB-like predicted nucleotidyltransferase (UPF0157 family)